MVAAKPGRDRELMKILAIGGPLLLLAYGVLRLVDGRDGIYGPGWAWNAGHVCFLVAFLMFASLAWRLRGVSPLAAVAALAGSAAFVWVILGDLFAALPGLPDPLMIAGPLLFQFGMLALLTILAIRRTVPLWSPLAVLAGFVLFMVDLDLLPLGALLLLAGLAPLTRVEARGPRRRDESAAPSVRHPDGS
jgi:hypothetical protein